MHLLHKINTMNILSRTFQQLVKFESLMQKDLKDGLITVNYLINETECKILDYNKIQKYLTQNKVHNNTLLKEILIKCKSIINLWNIELLPLKDRYLKEPFIYSNDKKKIYHSTPLDFYTLIAYKDKLKAVNGKIFFFDHYSYNLYLTENIAQKCALIENWTTAFLPDLITSNQPQQTETKNTGAVLIKNQYPKIFKNDIGFALFTKMHEYYKDENKDNANFGFLFFVMEEDFLVCSQADFVKHLSKYNVNIDKIDNRQYYSDMNNNKKSKLYNSTKQLLQKEHDLSTI